MEYVEGKLSVIVPAYNEEPHIYNNLNRIDACLAGFAKDYEIIVVNDGSRDHTLQEVMRAKDEHTSVHVVTYEVNRGKGGAVKEGVLQANGEYIAFLDADLDLEPEHIERFLHKMQESQADIVIGSKLHKDSVISYPIKRKIMSYGYYGMLKLLFRLNIKDTQTGVKLFRANVLLPIAKELQTSGYAFDIELLVKASQRGYKLVEMPVVLHYQRQREERQRIRISSICEMFKDTLRVWKRTRKKDGV